MPRRKPVCGLLFLVILGGCTGRSPELGRVGPHTVSRADVEKRQRAVRAMYRETDPATALQELCTARVAAELLERYGLPIRPEDLRIESDRIDAETKEPALLKKVKAELGDPSDYLRIFVLSSLAVRRLQRDVFATPKGQGEAFTRADRLWNLAGTDRRRFRNWPLPEGVIVGGLTAKDVDERHPAEKAWLEALAPGERAPTLIDAADHYLVFRRLKQASPGGDLFEVLTIQKEAWDSWLARQKSTVTVSGACAAV